jgi:hypothetical protein
VATMMLEIPEELNGMLPALRGVVDAAMTQVERGRTGGTVDYGAFEHQMAKRVAEVERRAHEATLAALDVDQPRVFINKVLHRRVLRSETSFQGLAGASRVMRSLYRPVGERNASVVDLVALRTGAVDGVPDAAQHVPRGRDDRAAFGPSALQPCELRARRAPRR